MRSGGVDRGRGLFLGGLLGLCYLLSQAQQAQDGVSAPVEAARAASASLALQAPVAFAPDRLPVTAYAGLDTVTSLALSPDGELLVGIVNKPDAALLFVSDFDGAHLKVTPRVPSCRIP